MSNPIEKTCPRCGRPLFCYHNTMQVCPCAGVKLNAAAREQIRAEYTDCLCVDCLQHYASLYS